MKYSLQTLANAFILSLCGSLALANHDSGDTCVPEREGCYINIFSETSFGGDHGRICDFSKLHDLEDVGGQSWTDRINSISAGPSVDWLEIYDEPGLKASLGYVLKNQDMDDTGGSIASLDLRCK